MKKLFIIITFFNVMNAYAQQGSENTSPYTLIAGGSKGIGYAIAEALAKRGYNLILIARHTDSLIPRRTIVSIYNKVGKK